MKHKESEIKRLGFHLNPFHFLEASADPRLGHYLVGHEGLDEIEDDSPSFLFAPAGGGKTALRLYVEQQCWQRPYAGPLPISYLATPESLEHGFPTIEAHYQELVSFFARALFFGILTRPERLLLADSEVQRETVLLLDQLLPTGLSYYLRILSGPSEMDGLLQRFDPNRLVQEMPPPALVVSLIDRLRASLEEHPSSLSLPRSSVSRFEALVTLACGGLGFRSIFILLDGLDATPETYHQPERAYTWLAPLLEEMPLWAARRIYLKGFLPIEMHEGHPLTGENGDSLALRWEESSLVEMLEQRVRVATEEQFSSFDAISVAQLRDVEIELVRRVPSLLPREVLRLADLLLTALAEKADEYPRVTRDDLAVAEMAYQVELGDLTFA